MLVLSRKEGERIRVGDDIFITVVHATKDRVRIGVDAPLNTVILRDELRVKEQNEVNTDKISEQPKNNDNIDQNNDLTNNDSNIKLAS
ncbi:MAG: carbon storage regulator [Planctomycetaceae bacterium]|jgi:carbon storage regulator|nr:carbon storage regulator [Planctomycetaceae bacterium]